MSVTLLKFHSPISELKSAEEIKNKATFVTQKHP